MNTSSKSALYAPPPAQVPMGDESWRRWFQEVVWGVIGRGVGASGPQGTFPKLQVGKASFTRENEFQELLNVNQGLYVTYSSTVQGIIYGFACNVHRAGGNQFTVGAQINAWGDVGSSGDVVGLATTALGSPASGVRNLGAFEPDIASLCDANTGVKWGMNVVFKDRLDSAVNAADGLTSNYYNYQSIAMVVTSQARSALGEFCGWSGGIDFIDGWCDTASVPAWSAVVTYGSGAIVSSGGLLWKAIVPNLNSLPAVGAVWVQRTYSGTTNNAVGIDFSSLSTTTMGRMASAIRLRSSQTIHWEESGAVGTTFDAANAILNLCANQGTRMLGVGVSVGVNAGVGYWAQAAIALGGGAAPTLGTIGGSGPTSAAQAGWEKVVLNGVTYYRPLWT